MELYERARHLDKTQDPDVDLLGDQVLVWNMRHHMLLGSTWFKILLVLVEFNTVYGYF